MMELDILHRTPCFSNEMMFNQCLILKRVITKTIESKVGRGKTIQTINVPKYYTDQ